MAVRQSERGVALALVLVVEVLLSVTTVALLRTVGFRFHGVEAQRQRDTAFYAAEAGLQQTWIKLDRRLPPFTDPDNPADPWVDTAADDADPNNEIPDDPANNPDRSETIRVGDRLETETVVEGYAVEILVNRIATNPNRFSVRASADILTLSETR